MFPPFSEEKAKKLLIELINALNDGKITLEQVSRPSEERKNQPVMLGALVCLDENGNEVNLVTNSGNAKKLLIAENVMHGGGKKTVDCKNFTNEERKILVTTRRSENDSQFLSSNFHIVDSIVSSQQIEEALSEHDKKIHELTDKLKNKNMPHGCGKMTVECKNFTNEESEILVATRMSENPEKDELKKLCADSLEKVHSLYNFHCIDGKLRSLKDICAEYNHGKLPPTGTGDCCAPKLLDYAFSHGLKPISLAETLYSQFSILNSQLTPPCDERCGILLPAMTGLRILYQDDSICIVNKQSGLLSVPGRGEDKLDSVETRFRNLYGSKVEIKQPAVHRLDMETSGIMILAFTKEAHRELNRQFEAKEVQKEYIALLDGVLPQKGIPPHGSMELFFRLDIENRPHQIWDSVNGKSAVTEWEILGVERYHAPDGTVRNATRVLFIPHTGRTHQLRLASADSHGFGFPIIGDTLYGKCEKGERLMLHAQKVTFTHPATKERMTIECKAEF